MNTKIITRTFGAAIIAASLSFTGCLTDNDDGETGGSADSLSTKTVTAGAQTNTTYGSSIDIDNFISYKINEAETREQDIDLIFAYSTSIGIGGGAAAVYSPDTAKYGIGNGAGFDFMQDFENPNTTEIRSINVNFSTINTKAKLDSLWLNASPVTNGREIITEGSTFMAKSNLSKTVLIRVVTLTVAENGVVNFEGAAKF